MQICQSGMVVSFGFNCSIILLLFGKGLILTCMLAIAWEANLRDRATL